MVTIDQYSVTAIPLELMCSDTRISVATGFFYTRNGKRFLVSNWHVFSGRHPDTGQAMCSNGALPDRVSFPLHVKDMPGSWRTGASIDLGNNTGAPTWLQHPRGQEVDVAMIPVPKIPEDCITYDAVQPDETSNMLIMVGMDVFVVGFPLGMMKQGFFPVWKRASIASEPDLQVDNLPLFLIDTATRKGMSGSPVYARTFGYALTNDHNYTIMAGASTKFLGIYSGRYGAEDEFAAQLGRVWHRSVLDEIIDQGIQGSYIIR